MKRDRILVPVDFSEVSTEAVRTAGRFADPSSEITILHIQAEQAVASLDPLCFGSYCVPVNQHLTERASKDLEEVRRAELGDRERVHVATIIGPPIATAVIEFAKNWSADLIVLGMNRHNGISRVLKGSVSEGIVRKAPCPVLVVPLDRAEETEPSKTDGVRRADHAADVVREDSGRGCRGNEFLDALRAFQGWKPY